VRLVLLLLLVLVADTKVLELLGDLLEERHDGCDFEMRNTKSLEKGSSFEREGKEKRRGRWEWRKSREGATRSRLYNCGRPKV
jgi:hypothetical protein